MPGLGRLGDRSLVEADYHGCSACAHTAVGPAISGSDDVLVNHKPALRVGDRGVHSVCCGANTWQALSGSTSVLINHRPAHRLGDQDRHCGGLGYLIEGSADVVAGG